MWMKMKNCPQYDYQKTTPTSYVRISTVLMFINISCKLNKRITLVSRDTLITQYTMAGVGPATPHAFYTKPYARNDFVILRVISQRMALTAGEVKLLPPRLHCPSQIQSR